jgi:hypothetical protein
MLSHTWRMLTRHAGFKLNVDTGPGPTPMPRDKVFQKILRFAWEKDIVVVVAAGNDGFGPLSTLDRQTPQRLGTDTNPLITVGGAINNGSLYYDTTPFNPPAGTVWETIPGIGTLTGGSMTVYAQALDVRTVIADPGDFQNGTSFAAPQVVSQVGDQIPNRRSC